MNHSFIPLPLSTSTPAVFELLLFPFSLCVISLQDWLTQGGRGIFNDRPGSHCGRYASCLESPRIRVRILGSASVFRLNLRHSRKRETTDSEKPVFPQDDAGKKYNKTYA